MHSVGRLYPEGEGTNDAALLAVITNDSALLAVVTNDAALLAVNSLPSPKLYCSAVSCNYTTLTFPIMSNCLGTF